MKRYIIPLLFAFQAVVLLLCLVGFTLLKEPILELSKKKPRTASVETKPETPNFSPEELALQKKGKNLFEIHCSGCHAIKRRMIGPGLENICQKYASKSDREWLFSWIQNSRDLIVNKKDPKAIELWESFNRSAMPPFSFLAQEEIEAILAYVDPTCMKKP
ncbi:MAG: cytochrome c [Bacteroidota bacterium]